MLASLANAAFSPTRSWCVIPYDPTLQMIEGQSLERGPVKVPGVVGNALSDEMTEVLLAIVQALVLPGLLRAGIYGVLL